MINYISKQIQTIHKDPVLKIYGLLLSLTHVWTFLYWNKRNFFMNSQSSLNSEPICFPFFPDCDLFRAQFSPEFWQGILYFYVFSAIFVSLVFLQKKWQALAYWGLAFITLFKLGLHLSNYNFMGNYHYMAHFVTLAYLLAPHKKSLIKYLIIAFYISAGFLKINIDWLSGAAMIRTPYLYGTPLRLSLVYVLFLELIFVFGLIHPNRKLRYFCLLQFFAFHLFSWHVVGFFYPMVMFSLLGVFYLPEYFDRKYEPKELLKFISIKEYKSIYIILALFTGLQLLPFTMVDDPSKSGVARLSSLNMFDSKTSCHSLMVAKTDNGTIHLRPPIKNMGVRLKCDPLVFLNQAHQICRKNKETNEIKELSLHLFTRRVTSSEYKKVLAIKDICSLNNPLWAELEDQES